MMTTAMLPKDMQYNPDDAAASAARRSALTVDCRHGDTKCPWCLVAEARRVVEAADTPS